MNGLDDFQIFCVYLTYFSILRAVFLRKNVIQWRFDPQNSNSSYFLPNFDSFFENHTTVRWKLIFLSMPRDSPQNFAKEITFHFYGYRNFFIYHLSKLCGPPIISLRTILNISIGILKFSIKWVLIHDWHMCKVHCHHYSKAFGRLEFAQRKFILVSDNV